MAKQHSRSPSYVHPAWQLWVAARWRRYLERACPRCGAAIGMPCINLMFDFYERGSLTASGRKRRRPPMRRWYRRYVHAARRAAVTFHATQRSHHA